MQSFDAKYNRQYNKLYPVYAVFTNLRCAIYVILLGCQFHLDCFHTQRHKSSNIFIHTCIVSGYFNFVSPFMGKLVLRNSQQRLARVLAILIFTILVAYFNTPCLMQVYFLILHSRLGASVMLSHQCGRCEFKSSACLRHFRRYLGKSVRNLRMAVGFHRGLAQISTSHSIYKSSTPKF